MKFNNPKPDNALFTFYWDLMVDDITSRKNVSSSHLLQFKVLCDAYCQYDDLQDKVKEEGYVLTRFTDKGETISTNPHLNQLNRAISQIKEYSKMLGLILVKDDSAPSDDENDEDDWT